MPSFADNRREYVGETLSEANADPDPFVQFSVWFEQVVEQEADPTAMALATATADGRPSVRMVLLKGVDHRGFVFFTNYESRKAAELEASGFGSLLFFWRSHDRQVRIEGAVERVTPGESDAYFETRPVESRWSVYASPQSRVIDSRETLDTGYEAARSSHGESVRRPEWWGGYRIVPDAFEFWQGRLNRLHDRLRYQREPDGTWRRERLAP